MTASLHRKEYPGPQDSADVTIFSITPNAPGVDIAVLRSAVEAALAYDTAEQADYMVVGTPIESNRPTLPDGIRVGCDCTRCKLLREVEALQQQYDHQLAYREFAMGNFCVIRR